MANRGNLLGQFADRDQLLSQFMEQYPDPRQAWRASKAARNDPAYNPQEMADVEHNLWARYYGSQGLPEATVGLGGPMGWSLYKSARDLGEDMGLVEPDPEMSENLLTQMLYGQQGANQAFVDQLRRQREPRNLLRSLVNPVAMDAFNFVRERF